MRVSFKRYITSGDNRIYTNFGPNISHLLSVEQVAPFIPASAEDLKDYTNSIDYGISLGLGMEFPDLANNALFKQNIAGD